MSGSEWAGSRRTEKGGEIGEGESGLQDELKSWTERDLKRKRSEKIHFELCLEVQRKG